MPTGVRAQDFHAQELARTSWALARLYFFFDPLLSSIAAPALPPMSEFSAVDLANMAWALATQVCLAEPLLHAISASSIRLL